MRDRSLAPYDPVLDAQVYRRGLGKVFCRASKIQAPEGVGQGLVGLGVVIGKWDHLSPLLTYGGKWEPAVEE